MAPRRRHLRRERAFTLIELIVVIGVIAVLVAMLLPALGRAREQAKVVQCAAQLRQVHHALMMYLNDNHGWIFWRAAKIGRDGMDWYAYGGRETGNTYAGDQGDFCNRWQPRPLNRYLSRKVETFHCPGDQQGAP